MPRAAPHSHPSTPASHGPGRSARRPVLALPVSWQPAQALPSGRDPRARRAGALLEHSVTRLQRASVPGTCCGESQRLGRCPVGFRRSTVRGGRTRLAGLGGAVPQVPKVQKSRPRPAWAPRAAEAGRGSKPTGPALCSRFSLPRSRHRRAPLPLAGFTARKRRGGSRPGDHLGLTHRRTVGPHIRSLRLPQRHRRHRRGPGLGCPWEGGSGWGAPGTDGPDHAPPRLPHPNCAAVIWRRGCRWQTCERH